MTDSRFRNKRPDRDHAMNAVETSVDREESDAQFKKFVNKLPTDQDIMLATRLNGAKVGCSGWSMQFLPCVLYAHSL